MKKEEGNKILANHLAAVLNDPNTPEGIYNALREELLDAATEARVSIDDPATLPDTLPHVLDLLNAHPSSNEKREGEPAPVRTAEQKSDDTIFYLETPLTIRHSTGFDPEKLPESRLAMMAGVEYLFITERLFWIIQQLGMMKEHAGWRYSEQKLSDALETLGHIGQAVADEASERVQKLEHLCHALSNAQGNS
jgi:hypothetical protein